MTIPDLVPAPNVLYMGILMTDNEVPTQNNVYFLNNEGAISPARAKEICQGVYMWWAGSIMPLLSSELRLFHVIGLDMTGTPHLGGDSEPLADVYGGQGPAMPLVCCTRVRFLSGIPGKSTNGGNYLAGIPRDKVVKSHIDTGWLESVRTAYYELVSVAYGLNCTWVVVSRRSGGVVRTTALITPLIEVVTPHNRVLTYRQRIARFGT